MLNLPALTDAAVRDRRSDFRRQAREEWAADEADDA